MNTLRPLRGGCQCGRNRYIIAVPQDGINEAQVLFNTDSAHQTSLATPLAAYIRVPLSWYHSTTYSFFPDETHALIRRASDVVGRNTALRQSYGVPWFDGMVEGTRLGNMRRSQGVKQSQDGRVKVEWEIVEYSGNGDEPEGSPRHDIDVEMSVPGKRKMKDRDDPDAATGGN
ncbi:hypothetical protein FCULG_00008055 [Fusarium culmorum]|uniref:Uncharacterized protein n=1 Tax=Fusarium culmorum TaxID=5516 RepID=A0A2T4GZY1_FUSCU|nr:hypothetical protein FCULG_00008055 [Fusarium culmorum]